MPDYKISRKNAVPLAELVKTWLKAERISAPVNTRCIFKAWDAVSGASAYTLRRYFKDGTLHISLNSSVVRSQLAFQKDALIEKMNRILASDGLFDPDDAEVSWVKELKLK